MTTTPLINWRSSGATDPGKVRRLNEDAFLDKPDIGLWVVADGMGGHQAGDFASDLIVSTLSRDLPQAGLAQATQAAKASLVRVNASLMAAARERQQTLIGSTVVIFLARGARYSCIWAGDSRLYRLRHGVFEQLTHDHSEVQHLIDHGMLKRADSESHPAANVITRAIGALEDSHLDVVEGDLLAGDRFLLCSDGLYRELSEREMAQSMQFNTKPANTVTDLLSLALDRGARDNVTLVAVNFSDGGQSG